MYITTMTMINKNHNSYICSLMNNDIIMRKWVSKDFTVYNHSKSHSKTCKGDILACLGFIFIFYRFSSVILLFYFFLLQGVVDTINYGTWLTRGKLVVRRLCFVEQMTSSPSSRSDYFFFCLSCHCTITPRWGVKLSLQCYSYPSRVLLPRDLSRIYPRCRD